MISDIFFDLYNEPHDFFFNERKKKMARKKKCGRNGNVGT